MLPRTLSVCLLVLGPACASGDARPVVLPECPEFDASATPNVAGTYRYSSLAFSLKGTIAFQQEGNVVRVLDTSYDNADSRARALQGEATLQGNYLDVTLAPTNGDTDYVADVQFAFDRTGDTFCLRGFSDTNDDVGGEGSYTGYRQ